MPTLALPLDLPRKPRVYRAHVVDAGNNCCPDPGAGMAIFKCGRCGWESEWRPFRTVTEAKQGIPCEGTCNHPGGRA